MKKLLAALLFVIVGCAHTPTPLPTFDPLPFDEAEYAALPKTGTGIVTGQVFGKTRGGDIKKGAGNNVILIPATKWGTLRYQKQVLRGMMLSRSEDPRYKDYVFQKTTDGDGRFTFTNVPPGKYYAVSYVLWSVPGAPQQGGNVAREIDVQNDRTTEAMLTF